MNEANLEYLKKSLDYLGFGTRLNEVLESAVRREMPKFSLGISQHYTPAEFRSLSAGVKDHMRFELSFNKANESDTYYLNAYQAVLSRYDNTSPLKQSFDLERDHRMTALQAYRLMAGFSFEKEIYIKNADGEQTPEKRSVWLKLNPAITDAYGNHPIHRFYPEYNYDLEKSVAKYPFYLAGEDRKEKLIKELRNGGLAEVELMVENKPMAVFVAAEPQYKTLNIYNREMVKISDELIFNQSTPAMTTKDFQSVNNLDSASATVDKQPWHRDQEESNKHKIGR